MGMIADSPVRRGDWVQTFTGKAFWPLDPNPSDVDPIDIAHALSLQCRYAGHCREFYSVAEHSLHVSHAVSPKNALWGLLHDASEAYLVDVPRPVKWSMPVYVHWERLVMAAIASRFNLSPDMPADIKDIDNRILLNERDALMSLPPHDWNVDGDPVQGVTIRCYGPAEAERLFLERLTVLTAPDARSKGA